MARAFDVIDGFGDSSNSIANAADDRGRLVADVCSHAFATTTVVLDTTGRLPADRPAH